MLRRGHGRVTIFHFRNTCVFNENSWWSKVGKVITHFSSRRVAQMPPLPMPRVFQRFGAVPGREGGFWGGRWGTRWGKVGREVEGTPWGVLCDWWVWAPGPVMAWLVPAVGAGRAPAAIPDDRSAQRPARVPGPLFEQSGEQDISPSDHRARSTAELRSNHPKRHHLQRGRAGPKPPNCAPTTPSATGLRHPPRAPSLHGARHERTHRPAPNHHSHNPAPTADLNDSHNTPCVCGCTT